MEVKNLGEIWKITSVALAFIVVSLLAYAMWLKGNNTQLQSEIDSLNTVIEMAAKEMDKKQLEVNKTIENIKVIYKDKKVYIETFVKDENETDCGATSRFWGGYKFPSLRN